MKKIVRAFWVTFLSLIYLVFSGTDAAASHYVGSDITFTYLGTPGLYKITLKAYRDCGGIAYINPITLTGTSAICGNITVQLMQVSVTDASAAEVCPGQTTECSVPPNNSIPGIQMVLFEGTALLPPCPNWRFVFTNNARNAGIVNLNNGNSSSLDWYTEALVNTIPAVYNNSPVFSASPVPYVCLNDTVRYNPQVTDPDGDSLAFFLVSARGAGGLALPYTPGYSSQQPFGTTSSTPANNYPATLDQQTGQFTFKPVATGAYVVVIRVEEYRTIGGVPTLVGYVYRDIEVQAVVCTSPAPVISQVSLFKDNTFVSHLTLGQVPTLEACGNYCIEISANTPASGLGLNVSLTSNHANEIPNSVFTVVGQNTGSPVGKLCFTPTSAMGGHNYSFTVKVADDACPFQNDIIQAYQVHIQKNTGFLVQASDMLLTCTAPVQLTAQALPNTVALTSPQYTSFVWTAVDTAGQALPGLFAGGQNTSSVLNPVVNPVQTTRFILTATTVAGCTDTASVVVAFTGDQPIILYISAPTTPLLPGHFSNMAPIMQTPSAAFTYLWTPAAGLSSPTVSNPMLTFSGQPSVTYLVTVSNGQCSDTTSVTINFEDPGLQAGFTYNLNGCCQVVITNTSTGGSTYTYDFGDSSPLVTVANPTHTYTAAGNYNITLVARNAAGYQSVFTRTVSVVLATQELLASQVKLYPNPASGVVTVDLSGLEAGEAQVEIVNLLGQPLLRNTISSGAIAELDLTGIAAGSYLARIKLNNKVLVMPLLLQR